MSNIVCLDCGSDKLIQYQEKIVTTYRKINKNGKISKIKKDSYTDESEDTMPWGVKCEECGSCFNYDIDDNDVIISLKHKNNLTR